MTGRRRRTSRQLVAKCLPAESFDRLEVRNGHLAAYTACASMGVNVSSWREDG